MSDTRGSMPVEDAAATGADHETSDVTPIIVLTYTGLALLLVQYVVLSRSVQDTLPGTGHPLAHIAWWVVGLLVLWVALPLGLAHRLGFAARSLGLTVRGLTGKLWMYGALYLAVLLPVLWASRTPAFVATYPFVRLTDPAAWTWSLLLAYWALYAIQFACVEFFFRGFLVFTLRPRLGMAAIAVTAVPYMMIHFQKPMAEALAALPAGLVLGWLALRTNSIWGGVLLHVAVALTMDALAMGAPGGVGWPA